MLERLIQIVLTLGLAGSAVLTFTEFVYAAAPEPRPHEVFLKPEISVSGDAIKLSDLFDNVISDAKVATAPPPGDEMALPARRLHNIAVAHDLIWSNSDRLGHILVKRQSQTVAVDQILPRIAGALRESGAPEEMDIQLADQNFSMEVALGAAPAFEIKNVAYDVRTGSFSIVLNFPSAGLNGVERHLQGRAFPVRTIPVLARFLDAGRIITADDIAWESVRHSQIGRTTIVDHDELVGTQTRRPLEPSRPVRQTDVEKPVVLSKDSAVTIYYQIPGMTLTVKGRAMEDGGQNETVRILNTRSTRTILARIVGPNEVVAGVASGGLPLSTGTLH